jgi:co-chaperonin GroES (HSP10)
MTTTAMLHEIDPRDEILAKVGSLNHITVLHNQVLVATYIRPEQTKGKIILIDKTRDEDKFQGKVGLVIAKGPMAFVDDDRTQFGDIKPNINDWVAYRMSDGWQFTLKGRGGEYHCRMLHDVDIKVIVSHPDDII